MSRDLVAVAAAALASVAVVVGLIGFGGGDFEPAPVAAPCTQRPAETAGDGLTGAAERIGLTALDSAACELRIPRERLLLGLAGEVDLAVDSDRRTAAFRRGLVTAIDAEEQAGRLGGTEALLLRQGVQILPIDALLDRVFRTSG